jgi:ketosteroid isomerase-like protein
MLFDKRALIVALLFGPTVAKMNAQDLAERRAELTRVHHRVSTRAVNGEFIGSIVDVLDPKGFYGAAVNATGVGPAAARAFLERDSLNARSRAVLTIVQLDVSADGNDGYSYGYLDVIRPNGDTLPGSFKAYWRRSANGDWRALAFGRGRREKGAYSMLPDSLRPTARSYKSWPMRDTAEGWATLQRTETAFSDSSATSIKAAFMAFAAPDAGKIDGARYVFGREAIGRGFDNPPADFAGIAWRAERGTVSGSNDLGFNFGPVVRRNAPATAPQGGGFFTIWRRQANGEWRYVVD